MQVPLEWVRFCEIAKENPCVSVAVPRVWNQFRNSRFHLIDRELEGDWSQLYRAIRKVHFSGSCSPLRVSLARLTSNSCDRLHSLLEGEWDGEGMDAARNQVIEELKNEYETLRSRPGASTAFQENRLRTLRREIEKLGGRV